MTKATQLNIKNDEAHKLATELAGLTGESLTAAVTLALRERLARERRRRRRVGPAPARPPTTLSLDACA